MRQVNALESQNKDCVCLEKNAIPLSKDLKGATPPSSENLYEAVDVPAFLVSSKAELSVS